MRAAGRTVSWRRAARVVPALARRLRRRSVHGSWSVVTTVKAPRWMVDDFVRFFAGAGASEIFLFFDDPAVAEYTPHDAVRATVCGEAYWRGERPGPIEGRQYRNHARARRRSSAQWLLHVDIDERVHATESIDKVLEAVPRDVFSVVAPSREAVYTEPPSRDTLFRTRYFKNAAKADPALVHDLYGPDLLQFGKHGVWGHVVGKSFVRKGQRIKSRSLHRPVPADPAMRANHRADDLVLLHYEGMTFELFRDKLVGRSSGAVVLAHAQGRFESRRAYAWEVYRSGGEPALLALYRRLHVLEPDALDRALRAGYVEQRDLGQVQVGAAARAHRRLAVEAASVLERLVRAPRRPGGG